MLAKLYCPRSLILELLMLGALVDAADSLAESGRPDRLPMTGLLEEEEGARSSGFDRSGNRSLSADHDHLGLRGRIP